MRPVLPALVLLAHVLLFPALGAQDTWKELAAGGPRAARALETVRTGGARALRELLVAGLASEERKVRYFSAQLLPPELLREADLARLYAVLLETWGKEEPGAPVADEIREGLNDLAAEAFDGLGPATLAEVAGWGDQEKLVQALRGPSGAGAPWAAAGKKGRELREKLAQELFPATDAAASTLAARAILDSSWDPQERALLFWIVLPARAGGAYPGDEPTRARLKSILADRPDKPIRSLPLARLTQVGRSLPYLTGHPEALGLIRKALIDNPDGANQDLLWAVIRVLLERSPREVQERFWEEGLEPLKRILKQFPDPLLFLWIAPAMGGWDEERRPARQLAPILNAFLGGPLKELARRGQLTNELFQALLWLGDDRLLADALEGAPPEDLDALLEDPQTLLPTVGQEAAERLAAAKSPRMARVGRAALLALKDRPESQPDPVLVRLAETPDRERVGLLRTCLKRGLAVPKPALSAWWEELIGEEHPAGRALAKDFPETFRDHLAGLASDPARFLAALGWCARNRVSRPFETPLPAALREALAALPGPTADPELPGIVKTIAPWLSADDREALARRWWDAWIAHPQAMDAGEPALDLEVLETLFSGRTDALRSALQEQLGLPAKGRVAETCLGGLARLGHPAGTETIAALLEAGLEPTTFMALHACPVRSLLPRLQTALSPRGPEGFELFLQICWGAWAGPGPGPVLPRLPEPDPEWWDLAAAGRFTEIFVGLAERVAEEGTPEVLAATLQGAALSAREDSEKTKALDLLRPHLDGPHLGHYWTAVLAAAHLGEPKALAAREEALRAGRSLFVRDFLLPWACLERSKALAELLIQRGLPASGLTGGELANRLGVLVPDLDPMRMEARRPGGSWARQAVALLGGPGRSLVWDPVHRGWTPAR